MIQAGVISIGNELLSGQSVDTNLGYLSRRLLSMGIPVVGCWTVGDEISSIKEAIGSAIGKSDIVLITGGLGPTDDDVTREALAGFMGVELELQDGLLREISDFFVKRGIEMAETNRVQAYIPAGARGLSNEVGTAPGIMAEFKGRVLVAMPGVPTEMKRMFEDFVACEIEGLGVRQVVVIKKLKCFGTGESMIAQMLGDLMQRDRNPLINSTASGGVITLHIVAAAENKTAAEEMIEKDAAQVCGILGDLVYGRDEQTLADVVGRELSRRKKTIALVESCTGGLIAKMLTDTPGASEYFTYGWVTYSNEAKMRQLGVSGKLIEKYGAVSKEVAQAMATGARERAGTDFAISVTGIAGPTGGTEAKPVGLVFIAVDMAGRLNVRRFIFSHPRGHIRLCAGLTALNMLRLVLEI